jgi:hypothetical protein
MANWDRQPEAEVRYGQKNKENREDYRKKHKY